MIVLGITITVIVLNCLRITEDDKWGTIYNHFKSKD